MPGSTLPAAISDAWTAIAASSSCRLASAGTKITIPSVHASSPGPLGATCTARPEMADASKPSRLGSTVLPAITARRLRATVTSR